MLSCFHYRLPTLELTILTIMKKILITEMGTLSFLALNFCIFKLQRLCITLDYPFLSMH